MPGRRGAGAFRQILLALLLGLLGLLSAPVTAEPVKPLLLAGPPWRPYLEPGHPRQGLASEIVVTALRRGGHPCRIRLAPWTRLLWLVKGGRVDGLVGVWYSEARAKRLLFSDAYYSNQIAVAYDRKHPVRVEKESDLRGLRLGVREGAHYGGLLSQDPALERIKTGNSENLMFMLLYQRIDAAVDDRLVLQAIIDAHPRLRARLVLSSHGLVSQPLHFAMLRDRPGAARVIADFNAALAAMRKDGTLARIYRRYGIALGTLPPAP